MNYSLVKENTYNDSMKLMKLQNDLGSIEGVTNCGVAMGTPENIKQFRKAGLISDESSDLEKISPNDLWITVEYSTTDALSVIEEKIENHFNRKISEDKSEDDVEFTPKTIASAVRRLPSANLAFISVPGRYAVIEAIEAINKGLSVFMFSDNVSLEEEIKMKTLAEKRKVLVMGPDCGTAIIAGAPLGFSNVVRRGKISIIAASGTGLQEICCTIHKMGGGVAQAIGTGGRDLSSEVGGKTFSRALEALSQEDDTEVIILASKHADGDVIERIVRRAAKTKKKIVTCFIGSEKPVEDIENGVFSASGFEHAAAVSVALSKSESLPEPPTKHTLQIEMRHTIDAEVGRFSKQQKYVRAFFTGGSFSDQALQIFPDYLESISVYPHQDGFLKLVDPDASQGNCIVDLGDDYFTHGRLHPIIDPSQRMDRLKREMNDFSIRVILLDVMLGYGAHPDPAGLLAPIILEGKKKFEEKGQYLSVIVNICGTEKDVQNLDEQKEKISRTGAIVLDSSRKAALLACLIGSA